MSTSVQSGARSISAHSRAHSEKSSRLLGTSIGKIIPALVAAVVLAGAIYLLHGRKFEVGIGNMGPLVSLFVAGLFALAPLLACFAHTISIDRQKAKLDGLILPKIKKTQYFIIAKASLDSIRPASVKEPDYVVPMLLFAVIIVFCSLISFMALFWLDAFIPKSTILGGLRVLQDMPREADRDLPVRNFGRVRRRVRGRISCALQPTAQPDQQQRYLPDLFPLL